jgi:hypothetical protein
MGSSEESVPGQGSDVEEAVSDSQARPTPWWRTPWAIAFALGVLVLPMFRPLFSRIAPPPPTLGIAMQSGCGGADAVRAVAVCAAPGACTAAERAALFKTWKLGEQNGLRVQWLWLSAADEKSSADLQWSVCAADAGIPLADQALVAQRAMRHVLEHPAATARGAVMLVDRAGALRGMLATDDPMARREVVGRLTQLQAERSTGSAGPARP